MRTLATTASANSSKKNLNISVDFFSGSTDIYSYDFFRCLEMCMTEIRYFSLPTINDDLTVIERTYCELNTKYRNGEYLDEVELNWMDTANTWLVSAWSNL